MKQINRTYTINGVDDRYINYFYEGGEKLNYSGDFIFGMATFFKDYGYQWTNTKARDKFYYIKAKKDYQRKVINQQVGQ